MAIAKKKRKALRAALRCAALRDDGVINGQNGTGEIYKTGLTAMRRRFIVHERNVARHGAAAYKTAVDAAKNERNSLPQYTDGGTPLLLD